MEMTLCSDCVNPLWPAFVVGCLLGLATTPLLFHRERWDALDVLAAITRR